MKTLKDFISPNPVKPPDLLSDWIRLAAREIARLDKDPEFFLDPCTYLKKYSQKKIKMQTTVVVWLGPLS